MSVAVVAPVVDDAVLQKNLLRCPLLSRRETRLILPRVAAFSAAHPGLALHLALAHADRPVTPAPDIEIGFKPREALLEDETPLLPGTAAPVAAPALLAQAGGDAAALLAEGSVTKSGAGRGTRYHRLNPER